MTELDAVIVWQRLQVGATLFRPMDRDQARRAMQGRLETDGVLRRRRRSFDGLVADRLKVLRALDRRRRALRAAARVED